MNVDGILDPGSTGISRYCGHLAAALAGHDVRYRLRERPDGLPAHLHFGNSSRSVALRRPDRSYVVTVHDVVPRTAALRPVQRAALGRLVRRADAVVVHSAFAADLLARESAVVPRRLEVIPHGAPAPDASRDDARRALGWSEGELVAVLPGVVKRAKLAGEALDAAEPLLRARRLRLILAGRVADRDIARRARSLGADVLEAPDDETYDLAIAGADVVLVLRSTSVGETNGPLLEAIGYGRAVLATATGSIPEVAGDAALVCEPSTAGIRAGLESLCDPGERTAREAAARRRAPELSWDGVARLHAELFREVLDG